jgi:hypothetical protein
MKVNSLNRNGSAFLSTWGKQVRGLTLATLSTTKLLQLLWMAAKLYMLHKDGSK